MGEHVIAVIPNTTLKAGLMGLKSKQHTVVVTDLRVLFAQMTVQMMKQLVADARDNAKADGKGFFGQWGAQMGAYSGLAQRYLEMAPEQILAENPGNFAVDRSTIRKAQLKNGYTDDNGGGTSDRLIIKTADKKYDIALVGGAGQAREALITAELI